MLVLNHMCIRSAQNEEANSGALGNRTFQDTVSILGCPDHVHFKFKDGVRGFAVFVAHLLMILEVTA